MVETQNDEHDREMLVDDMHFRRQNASELAEDQVFRAELLRLLERIAKALERPIQVRYSY